MSMLALRAGRRNFAREKQKSLRRCVLRARSAQSGEARRGGYVQRRGNWARSQGQENAVGSHWFFLHLCPPPSFLLVPISFPGPAGNHWIVTLAKEEHSQNGICSFPIWICTRDNCGNPDCRSWLSSDGCNIHTNRVVRNNACVPRVVNNPTFKVQVSGRLHSFWRFERPRDILEKYTHAMLNG